MSKLGHHHHHSHEHHHHRHDGSSASIFKVFCLNLGFSIIELGGGLFTGSAALIADALHDFGDALVMASAYFFQKKSEAKPDQRYSYGYRRYSLLSAVITGLVLMGGSLGILSFALYRIESPPDIKTLPMVGFAILGLVVNGASFFQMNKADRGHNSQMIRWHLLEDTAGWAAVLLGAVVMHFTHWYWIDSALAAGIAFWILIGVAKSFWGTLQLFLQRVPPQFDVKKIENEIQQLPGVKDVHDIHLWSLDGVHHVLSIHVVRESSDVSLPDLKHRVREYIQKLGEVHATIEVEEPEEICEEDCD